MSRSLRRRGRLNARLCVRALEDLYDVPPGHFVSDRAYLPHSKPEDLALPLRASGYKLVFDYDRTAIDLGVQASNGGAVLVDGTWYCPSMPEPLQDASIHHLVTPRTSPEWIDAETYAQRIEQRARYELHVKERADDEGYVRRQCPAVGQSATVSCSRREPHAKSVDRPRASGRREAGTGLPVPERGMEEVVRADAEHRRIEQQELEGRALRRAR